MHFDLELEEAIEAQEHEWRRNHPEPPKKEGLLHRLWAKIKRLLVQ